MKKIYTKVLEKKHDLQSASEITQQAYLARYNFDYTKIIEQMPSVTNSKTIGLFYGSELISNISVSVLNENYPLPSETLFHFNFLERMSLEGKVMEIGRLSRKNIKPISDVPQYIETIFLLRGVVDFAINNRIDYWTATLHPTLTFFLKRKLKIPFEVIYHGTPFIDDNNINFTNHMGTYYANGLDYVIISTNVIEQALNNFKP